MFLWETMALNTVNITSSASAEHDLCQDALILPIEYHGASDGEKLVSMLDKQIVVTRPLS